VVPADLEVVRRQLGRPVRSVTAIAHRCPCGQPDVIATSPRLEDGSPFPTLYYLTCPRAASLVGTLEASGWMQEMSQRLHDDDGFAEHYRRAHEAYISARDALEQVPEIAQTSAGGMPDRVKCVHALVAHSLAAGPGVNPVGDAALARLDRWWSAGVCARPEREP
jgi:hypothetical protein